MGRATAKLPARRSTWNVMSTAMVGARPSTPKPTTLSTGRKASAAATPQRFTARPVAKVCVSKVSTFTARSMVAKKRVRVARSV